MYLIENEIVRETRPVDAIARGEFGKLICQRYRRTRNVYVFTKLYFDGISRGQVAYNNIVLSTRGQ